MPVNNEGYMTSTDVCRYMNVSMNVVNKLERDGHLKPKRKLQTNHRRYYLREDVIKFCESLSTNNE